MPQPAWEATLASMIVLLSLFVAAPAAAESTEQCIENACVEQISASQGDGSCEEAPSFHQETWALGVSYDDGADRAFLDAEWRCDQRRFFGSDSGTDRLAVSASTNGETLPSTSATVEWRQDQFGDFVSCSQSVSVSTPEPVGAHLYRGDCPAGIAPGDVLPPPASLP